MTDVNRCPVAIGDIVIIQHGHHEATGTVITVFPSTGSYFVMLHTGLTVQQTKLCPVKIVARGDK